MVSRSHILLKKRLFIDKHNGNDHSYKAVEQDMKNIMIVFREFNKCEDAPELQSNTKSLSGFEEIKYHMIFDIKMDGSFTRKARYIEGGYTTETPSSTTYSSVVSCEYPDSIFSCIAFRVGCIIC